MKKKALKLRISNGSGRACKLYRDLNRKRTTNLARSENVVQVSCAENVS